MNWTIKKTNEAPADLGDRLLSDSYTASSCGGDPSQIIGQGSYDNVIAVDPANSDRIWVGGIDLYHSTDQGATWKQASSWATKDDQSQARRDRYVHADHHAIVFHPQYNGTTNQTMYVATDGGVFKTTNSVSGTKFTNPCSPEVATIAWTPLSNGYVTTQNYSGTIKRDGGTVYGGTQDNGSVFGTLPSTYWSTARTGDGYICALDPSDQRIAYFHDTIYGLVKSTDGGANLLKGGDSKPLTFAPTTEPPPGRDKYFNAYAHDPQIGGRLFWAGKVMYRTTDGGVSWAEASTPFSTNERRARCMAISPQDPNYVVVATDDGINRTTAATTSTSTTPWPLKSFSSFTPSSCLGGIPSSLAFDPTNKNVAYLTFSNRPACGSVHRSTDAGATWDSIQNDLPTQPVQSIVVDERNPAQLFLGTDFGVFTSTNTGRNWMWEASIPKFPVEHVAINMGSGERWLHAFTHGRGVYRAKICPSTAVAPAPVTIYQTTCSGGLGSSQALLAGYSTGLCPPDGVVRPKYEQVAYEALEFLQGGAGPCPSTRLNPQKAGQDVDVNTVFPVGDSSVTFRFQLPDQAVVTASQTITVRKQGDLDHSGWVDIFDVTILSNYIVGNQKAEEAPFVAKVVAANANASGQPGDYVIDVFDLVTLQSFIVGNTPCLTEPLPTCPESLSGVNAPTGMARLYLVPRASKEEKDAVEYEVWIDTSSVSLSGKPVGLGGFLLRLEFDPKALELRDVVAGADRWFAEAPVFTHRDRANVEGRALVVSAHGGVEGPQGPAHVATIRLNERQAGSAASLGVIPIQVVSARSTTGSKEIRVSKVQ